MNGRADEPAGEEPDAVADRDDRQQVRGSDDGVLVDGEDTVDGDEGVLTAEDERRLLDESILVAEADPDELGERFVDGTPAPSAVEAERDEYREALLRVKADFDNYRKRAARDHAATVERAAEKLVAELLPVLDACEAAIAHGATDVEPVGKSLLDVLEKAGLERMAPEGGAFDPNLHEAVMHEPGDGDEPTVTEVMRTGYLWNGRVLRPAMVKVKG